MAAMKLSVTIFQATNLRQLNFAGDKPYCVCQVTGARGGGGEVPRVQTKAIANSLDPVWAETFELHPWHSDDSLEFTICDKGLVTSRAEGKAVLPGEYIYPDGFEGDVPIEGLHDSVLQVRVVLAEAPRKDLPPALPANDGASMQSGGGDESAQRLQVTVLSARGLTNIDMVGEAPYCVCEVVQSATRGRKAVPRGQTTPLANTLEPTWSDVLDLEPWFIDEPLEFIVHDVNAFGKPREGRAALAPEHFYPHGCIAELPVNGLRDAVLQVQVVPVGAATADANGGRAVEAAVQNGNEESERKTDMRPQMLQVTILSATGLPKVGFKCDELVQCSCRIRRADQQAAVVQMASKMACVGGQHGADPVWVETMNIGPWSPGEALEFELLDYASSGPMKTGIAPLPSEYFADEGFDGDVPIDGRADVLLTVRVLSIGPYRQNLPSTTASSEEAASRPDEAATAASAAPTQCLQVSIVQAVGLKHLNILGEACHCACMVKSQRACPAGALSLQTKQALKSSEPLWNETFKLEDWQPGEALEFTVHDTGPSGSAVQGKALLPSAYFYPNGFEGDVPIEGLAVSLLSVIVVPLPPAPDKEHQHAQSQVQQQGQQQQEQRLQQQLQQEEQRRQQLLEQREREQQQQKRLQGQQQLQQQAKRQEQQQQEQLQKQPQHQQMQLQLQQQDASAAADVGPQAQDSVAPAASMSQTAPAATAPQQMQQRLKVTVIQAFGLQHLKMSGGDTSCLCEISAVAGREAASSSRRRTKSVNGGLQPTWNETFEVSPWAPGEAVQFTVVDGASGVEGTAVLPSEYFASEGFEGDVPIDGLHAAMLHVRVLPDGVNIRQADNKPAAASQQAISTQEATSMLEGGGASETLQKLRVAIVQATGLRHLNMVGDSICCVCQLPPVDGVRGHARFTTRSVSKTLEPLWDETFELEPWRVGDPVEFTIFDQGLLNARTEGKAVLPSEYIWPSGFEGDVPIEGLADALISVRITPAGAATAAAVLAAREEGMQPEGTKAVARPAGAAVMLPESTSVPTQQTALSTKATLAPANGVADASQAVAGSAPTVPAQRLRVAVLQASGLQHLNFGGVDNYCLAEVQPTDKVARGAQFRTKQVNLGMAPTWNETSFLDPWKVGDALHFTIYDKATNGAATGKAVLPSEYIWPNGFEGDVPIEGLAEAMLQVRIVPDGPSLEQAIGDLAPTAMTQPAATHPATTPTAAAPAAAAEFGLFSKPKNPANRCRSVEVQIVQATGLRNLNMTGDNMYCTCQVQRDVFDSAWKTLLCETKKVSNSLDPIWNEAYLLPDWCPGKGIEFTVYDRGLTDAKSTGKAVLPAEYFDPEAFEGDVPIEGLANALLQVRVRLQPLASTASPGPTAAPPAGAATSLDGMMRDYMVGTDVNGDRAVASAAAWPPSASPPPAQVCVCENVFLEDSRFCRKCGRARPQGSSARDSSPPPAKNQLRVGRAIPMITPARAPTQALMDGVIKPPMAGSSLGTSMPVVSDLFSKIDTNHDGVLDRSEFSHYLANATRPVRTAAAPSPARPPWPLRQAPLAQALSRSATPSVSPSVPLTGFSSANPPGKALAGTGSPMVPRFSGSRTPVMPLSGPTALAPPGSAAGPHTGGQRPLSYMPPAHSQVQQNSFAPPPAAFAAAPVVTIKPPGSADVVRSFAPPVAAPPVAAPPVSTPLPVRQPQVRSLLSYAAPPAMPAPAFAIVQTPPVPLRLAQPMVWSSFHPSP
eukprot:TRINITY_DN5370_c0_g2_i1.p1 TRINITY_DN5370_c0_g2~~TRINITY_DN5370_c0_g2_i1.p1  ORF type:complete len:1730 (+),score=362.01 TRINITY_DN5370_c0_g2_i1:146-5335(+)